MRWQVATTFQFAPHNTSISQITSPSMKFTTLLAQDINSLSVIYLLVFVIKDINHVLKQIFFKMCDWIMIPVYPRNIAYINSEQIIAFPGGNRNFISVVQNH